MAGIFLSALVLPFVIMIAAILIGLIVSGACLMGSAIKDAKNNGWVARNNVCLAVGVPLLVIGVIGTFLLIYGIIFYFVIA